jgi:hypothetical protein
LSAPSSSSQRPIVEVSWGELIDKLTILEIKERRLTSPAAVANVRRELEVLTAAVRKLDPPAALAALKGKLAAINEKLWQIEDEIRAKEAAGSFDAAFIELARSIYVSNDTRAQLKREINTLLNSELIEEKQYTPYSA